MSLHIGAKVGEIADRILLPGDPLRAKYIAETFLKDPVCFNNVRGMLGFTGTYNGKKVSVMGTGMGVPSHILYVHELLDFYGVKRLIRVGTCGSISPKLNLRDIIVAQSCCCDSMLIRAKFKDVNYCPTADFALITDIVEAAKKDGLKYAVGQVYAADLFYDDEGPDKFKILSDYGVLGVEMESAALFTEAAKYRAQAATILTVSDNILTGEATTAEERQLTFNGMIKMGLEAI